MIIKWHQKKRKKESVLNECIVLTCRKNIYVIRNKGTEDCYTATIHNTILCCIPNVLNTNVIIKKTILK